MRKCIREEQDSAYLDHPYTLKLQTCKSKLRELLNKIFTLADNDVIVCDRETGLVISLTHIFPRQDGNSLLQQRATTCFTCEAVHVRDANINARWHNIPLLSLIQMLKFGVHILNLK